MEFIEAHRFHFESSIQFCSQLEIAWTPTLCLKNGWKHLVSIRRFNWKIFDMRTFSRTKKQWEANSRKNQCVSFDFFMYMWYKSLQIVFVDLLDSFIELAFQFVRVLPQEVIQTFEFSIFIEWEDRNYAVLWFFGDFQFVHVDDFLSHDDKVE